MNKALVAVVPVWLVAALLALAFAPAPDAGSKAVEFKTVNGYAESPDSGLKGDYSCVAFTAKSEFDRIFNPVLTPRGLPDPVSKAAFGNRLFVAVIKRAEGFWEFKVEKVTANGETLTVHYSATPRGKTSKAGMAEKVAPAREGTSKAVQEDARTAPTQGLATTFDSPLILSVPSDKYLTVVFIENGHRVGTARVGN